MAETHVPQQVRGVTEDLTVVGVRFAVLGPLEVAGPAGSLGLGSPKQRRLLAVLISRVGEPVSIDGLVDAVWDGAAPRSAAKTLQGYVVHLRQALAGAEDARERSCAIVTTAAGYRLDIAADDAVDSARFTSLLASARLSLAQGELASARVFVHEALALWRGPAYAEFAGTAFAESEAARLEELRLVAAETRFEVELGLGEDAALVPELEKALTAQPTRERLWELLIRALYRAGRQSDALFAYVRARDLLAAELGVEPGPGLRCVQAAVLAQDAGLDRGTEVPLGGIVPSRQPTAGVYTFDGRDRDLAWLRAHWLRTVEHGSRIVVVSGAAGIGKTRLLGVFADEVEHSAGVVVRRTGAPAPGAAAIAALADGSPVLIVLDDPLTGIECAALSQCRVLVVAGLDADRAPGHVLRSLAGAERRELQPLPHSVCERIAARWLDEAPGGLDTAALIDAAAGNPGRLHQLLAGAVQERAQQCVDQSARALPAARAGVTALRAELAQGVRGLRRRRLTAPAQRGDPRTAERLCPYRGLETYGKADAMFFCGRDTLIERLVARVADTPLVAVVGASGSGKSSLVRAGLLAALTDGCLPGSSGWQQFVVTPVDGLPTPATSPAVIVIDQFEQAWVAYDDAARAGYLDGLIALADAGHRVVVTLRADHVDRCVEHPRLRELIADGTVLLGPMSTAELAEVVVGPAQALGCEVESALVSRILDDVRGLSAPLPLLSTALAQTWEGDLGVGLRLQSYLDRGGVAGSIAHWAENAYQALSPVEQTAARHVFLRLATGEPGLLVRRRCPYVEAVQDQAARRAVDVLAAARLVTVDDTGVEVMHEALFANWPRLADWLDEDAQGRRLRAHLAPAALDWDRSGRPDSDLYRGVRLDAAAEWARTRLNDLTATEHAFISASVELADRELRTERRRRRRLRFLLTAVGTAAVLALGAAAIAVTQRSDADRQRHAATSQALLALARQLGAASLVNQPVDHSLLLAVSAVRLDNNVNTRSDLLAALQRSPAAQSIWHSTGAPLYGIALSGHDHLAVATSLEGDIATWNLTRSRTPDLTQEFENDYTPVLAARPHSNEVALANVSAVDTPLIKLWDPGQGQQIGHDLTGATSRIASLSWSPDGRHLAAAQDVGDVLVWDLDHADRPPARITREHPHSSPGAVGFPLIFPAVAYAGPDRYAVVEGNGFGQVSRVGAARPLRTFEPGIDDTAAAGNPQGTMIAVGHSNGTVTLDSLPDLRPLQRLTGHAATVDAITFSADGRLIATMGADDAVNVTNLVTGQLLGHLTGHTAQVTAGVFTADNRHLYTSSSDGTVIGWDIANLNNLGPELSAPQPQPSSYLTDALAASRNGQIAVLYNNGTGRIWDSHDVASSLIRIGRTDLSGGSFSPDGRLFAVADYSGPVDLLDVRSGRIIATPAHVSHPFGAQFSPDGRRIAVITDDGYAFFIAAATRHRTGAPFPVLDHPRVVVWSPDSRKIAVNGWLGGGLAVYDARSGDQLWDADQFQGVAWSPDGSTIASGGDSAHGIQLWRAADGTSVGGGWKDHALPFALAYSPDGSLLASTGYDGTVVVRDVATGQQLGPPLVVGSTAEQNVTVRFDGQGDLIIATTDNGLWRWHIDLPYLIHEACTIAGRNLTADEWTALHTAHPYVKACA